MNHTWYIAGGHNHPGTNLPANVTGDCPHRHRTSAAAQRCIDSMDAAVKRGHGRNAYADRIVIEVIDGRKVRRVFGEVSS
jgi:hypothetical protein